MDLSYICIDTFISFLNLFNNMKNLIHFLSLCLLVTSIVSCSKDAVVEPTKETAEVTSSTAIEDLHINVSVEDGLLAFESFDAYKDALEKLSTTEDGFYTHEAIANWQEAIGFQSMGLKYQNAMNEFETVDSEEAYNQFMQNHPGINMSDDPELDEIILPVAHIQMAYLLNNEGKVMIGENLHMFTETHQLVVLGKEESKLQTALSTLTSDEELGIFAIPYILDEVSSVDETAAMERSGTCGTSYDGQQQSGSKKVVSEIRLIFTASPRGFLNGGGWDYFVDAKFKGKSEKKNWRGKWRSYSTWMDYFQHYSVCATINGSTSNPDRQYHHYPPNPTSNYSYNQRLISGFSMFNAPPIMSAAFNFWIHRVKNRHDNITLDRWCF